MSKAEEATNDFCTRCFKYNRCTKAQSECVIADSYQEGFEDGYHKAEKDLKLTCEDMAFIRVAFDALEANIHLGAIKIQPMTKEYYEEVLKRFNEKKEK